MSTEELRAAAEEFRDTILNEHDGLEVNYVLGMYDTTIGQLLEAQEQQAAEGALPGQVSDGYHTFDELYDHRHRLFIALMRSHPEISWRANNHHDGTGYDGWFLAGMDLPTGQISYHMPIELWEELDFSGISTSNKAPEWDGHNSNDVVVRLRKWKTQENNGALPVDDEWLESSPFTKDERSVSWRLYKGGFRLVIFIDDLGSVLSLNEVIVCALPTRQQVLDLMRSLGASPE